MPRQDREHYYIQAVDNALNVLETLGELDQAVHVTRLSERLGLNKSTVFRLLATFQRRGYVVQDQGSHRYRLGLSAFETSQKLLSRMELLNLARPVMAQLLRQHNETVYLAVYRNREILFLDMQETTQQVKAVGFLGRSFGLTESAAGKLYLALQAGTDSAVAALRPTGDKALPLEKELASIRELGYCLNQEGFAQGIAALAAPVYHPGQGLIGALVLLGPDYRLNRERAVADLATPLIWAAETVSSRLGSWKGTTPPDGA